MAPSARPLGNRLNSLGRDLLSLASTVLPGRHRTRATWKALILVLGRVCAWDRGTGRYGCKLNSQPRSSRALAAWLGGWVLAGWRKAGRVSLFGPEREVAASQSP